MTTDEVGLKFNCLKMNLNPIRSNIANPPETSDFTSIKRRITAALNGAQPKTLLPFVGNERKEMPKGLMFQLKDYLQLVEDTGQLIRNDNKGHINQSSQNILKRINISTNHWLKITNEFGKLFKGPVGTLQELTEYCEHLEKQRWHYCSACQHLTAS
jgi:hypothetical protein